MRLRGWLLPLLLVGCQPAEGSIALSVVTDLEPGADFIGVEVEAFHEGERVAHDETVVPAGSWLEPTPIATLTGLPQGNHHLVVTLLAAARDIVVTRETILEVESHHAVTVLLTSSCVGVYCPGDGDAPDATTCVGGECVPPSCGDGCGRCASDADCPSSPVCGAGRCDESGCLYPDGVDACPEGEACHPSRGCVAASCECDDGDPCTIDLCEGTRCINQPRDGVPCDDGVFCNGDDRCTGGACVNVGPRPCDLASCDEGARSCVIGCDTAADCPAPVFGTWGECVFADGCAETGERAREVTRFECVARRCEPQTQPETEACTRETDGTSCGASGCDAWTECGFAICAPSGARYRTCSTSRCVAGACVDSPRTEMEPCSRGSQDGLPCDENTGYGYCRGTCAGTTCADLCAYCMGFCSLTGCRASSGGGPCPAP